MTDNQDSKIGGAVQPPTDRPLTAGDAEGWIPNPGFNPVGEAKVDTMHANGAVNLGWTAAQWSVFWDIAPQEDPQDIIAYRLARPATSAASAGAAYDPTDPPACGPYIEGPQPDYAPELKAHPEPPRDPEWVAKKNELLSWTGSSFLAGEKMSKAENLRHKGDLYGFLCGLLGWMESGAENAAALASPPVSERERELEGALAKAVVFNAYRAEDPLAIRLEFVTEEDRLAAANAIDRLTAQPQEPV